MHKTRHQKRNQVSIPRSGPNPHGARLCARIKRRPTANEQLLIVQVPIFVDPEISRANGNPSVTPFHVCASRSCEKNIDPLQVCSPSRPTCTKLILLDIPFKGGEGGRGGEGGIDYTDWGATIEIRKTFVSNVPQCSIINNHPRR